MKTFHSQSLEETQKAAAEWLGEVSHKYKDQDEALVAGLSGHLGAGKTAFVKMMAKLLGVKEEVTSPTFVIMKIYEVKNENVRWKRLVHIDAYRLESGRELEALNYEKIVADTNNLVMIEWPENVGLKSFDEMAKLSFEIKEGVYVLNIV